MSEVVEFPTHDAETAEVEEMRVGWLKVRDERDAMARVATLAERISDILNEIEIADADRQSLLWHASLVYELAQPRSDVRLTPLCALRRFKLDPGAA